MRLLRSVASRVEIVMVAQLSVGSFTSMHNLPKCLIKTTYSGRASSQRSTAFTAGGCRAIGSSRPFS